VPDPEFKNHPDSANLVIPARKLGAHVAALGMKFYTGKMFPAEYRNQIFIAEHGSWNRTAPVGYRISLVRLQDGRAISYEEFATAYR
jgi:glucose/arabinose dehydrogenase